MVMSYLPDFFLASWQAKQFSFRIGATSLMKLTGLPCWAEAVAARRTGGSRRPRRRRRTRRKHNTGGAWEAAPKCGGVGWY